MLSSQGMRGDGATTAMKVAATIVPAGVGLLTAGLMITEVVRASREPGATFSADPAIVAMVVVLPVALALAAWRWRAVAGALLVLLGLTALAYILARGWGGPGTAIGACLSVAGVLDLVVWQRESGSRITLRSAGAEAVPEADVMCWAARWVSVTVGAWLAVTGLALLVLEDAGTIEFQYGYREVLLLLLVPLGLAALAWRRHLAGGALMAALSAIFLVYTLAKADSWGDLAPFNIFTVIPSCVIFLVSGILHLVVWTRQTRRSEHG